VDLEKTLATIEQEIQTCHKCLLSKSRKNTVPGEGSEHAEIIFIGEGPGFYENEQGRPFVGQAGKFLDELLESAGLKREKVYITNVVKCRPPGNREPQEDELSACAPFLEQQIAIIDPLVIVTLGRFSMARYFKDAKISRIHGQPSWNKGRYVVPMYHPAAGLHQASLRPIIQRDFLKLPSMLETAMKMKSSKHEVADAHQQNGEDATQLSFF